MGEILFIAGGLARLESNPLGPVQWYVVAIDSVLS